MSTDTRVGHTGKIIRKCACRGWIIGQEGAGLSEVVTHQLTEPHRSWDRLAWVEQNTAKVNVPIATLRKVA